MADNTRVNDLQDKLLKAMDILNAQALNSISFDKTITCKIENDKDKKDGKYEVNDGNRIFAAYSTDTRLRVGDTVYVTVPEGKFENQKMIIGKKTADNDKPFNFTQPFDTFFDMTGNILGENIGNELIANALNKYDTNKEYEQKLLIEKTNLAISNYTRLGLKADFKSWIKEAIRGDYGLLIIINTTEEDAVNKEPKTNNYSFIFNNSDMYGNPYSFETNYSQEMVIPLESVFGVINTISVYFYQNHNFYDRFNEPILCSEKGYLAEQNRNQYIKDNDGDYQLKENDTLLAPNLFVSNLYLSFGYDISTFTDDYVEIYTQNRNSYRRSTKVGDNYIEQNKKEINMRWVHLKDGVPIDMVAAAGKNLERTELEYEVRWYKYSVGAAAADPYCGIYWEDAKHPVQKQWENKIKEINENLVLTNEEKETQLKEANKIYLNQIFKYVFNPDVNKQQEKIKAIVIYKDGNIPYRSNELIFENEEQLPPSKEAQHITTALTITTKDNSNGNYMIYGQDNSIKDTEYGKETRMLEAWFDVNSDGKISIDTEKINDIKNLIWTFPDSNSMIQLINGDDTGRVDEDNNKILSKTTVTGKLPKYKIKSYYSPSYSNNTVQCQYTLNGVIYTTEKEFTFGPAGTMGTDQTLVIDFVGDKNAVINKSTAEKIQIQLYDNQNKLQQIPNGKVKWAWYYNSDLNGEFPQTIQEEGNAILELSYSKGFNIESLYILQATVGNLTTYFPVPVRANNSYSYIKGPTQVIYQTDGEPAYNREEYKLYDSSDQIKGVKWRIRLDREGYKYSEIAPDKLKQEDLEAGLYYDQEYDWINPSGHILDSENKYYTRNETVVKQRCYKNPNTTAITQIGGEDGFVAANTEKYWPSLSDSNKLQPLTIYIKDAPVYGVQAIDDSNNVLWTQPILVLQNQWPNGVVNAWDGESLKLDYETQTVLAAAISAGKKNSEDNTFSGVMMGDWGGQDVAGEIASQTGLYGFHHGAMSYAFKEDGTAFIGKSSMARINFDGSNATIYSSGYKDTVNKPGGMMIDLYNNGEPYIELKSKEENGKSSIMRFDTKNSKSEIKMTLADDENKKPRYIRITNSDSSTNPLSIGDDFSVGWQGSINAKSGKIGSWQINHPIDSNGALQSDDGKIVLSTEGTGTILINEDDIIIRGSYYDREEGKQKPTQMTLSNNSIIHGGIIEAGTLQSNGTTGIDTITLDGYLVVKNGTTSYGRLGYVASGTGHIGNGIGLQSYSGSNIVGEIKSTSSNTGMNYDQIYISLNQAPQATSSYRGEFENYIHIGTTYSNTKNAGLICDIPAENQHGIYARFA